MVVFVLAFIVLLNFGSVFCDSDCPNLVTCGSCISHAYETCVWCTAEEHNGHRCQSINFHEENKSWCATNVYNPQPNISTLRNSSFNSGLNKTKVIQVVPQEIEVLIRPGVEINFNVSYKPAKDYPLDVYYLMDYSYTMRGSKKKLEDQGLEIYKELTMLTNNVRMGLGSFVEKPAMPFAGQDRVAYSFKNHLSLTHNMSLFVEGLKSELTGSNYDDPEAGLDALMEAMVCQEELGWREKARRIIIMTTDATYHSAGDGKFVGAINPHDMKCHLENDTYTMSLVYDYPSVSQINKVASDHNFKIIFVAINNVKEVYEGLAEKIRGAKYVEWKDNSNLITLIKMEYLELINNVEMYVEAQNYIDIGMEPDCRIKGNCMLKHNESINMNVKLKPKWVPKDKMKGVVRIGPVALSEYLKVTVFVDSECDCERNITKIQLNSPKCSGNGIYRCGICECNENKYGDDCRCEGAVTSMTDLNKCKMQANDTTYCNGRGTCSCGKCVDCQTGFSGEFCQYDDNACVRPGNKLCSGMGTCRYGKCQCVPGRTGPGCDCPLAFDSCYAPRSKQVCSGNGVCECGECICLPMSTTNRTCSGRFCDSCSEFAEKRCLELEDYVDCYRGGNKTHCDPTSNQTSPIVIETVDAFENDTDSQMAKWCRKHYENGTSLLFKYLYPLSTPNTMKIIVQKDLEQPYQVDLWLAVGVPFGLLILVGLLTIIVWKILVDIHDAREYKNFSEKAAAAGFDVPNIVNPVYLPPNLTYTSIEIPQEINDTVKDNRIRL